MKNLYIIVSDIYGLDLDYIGESQLLMNRCYLLRSEMTYQDIYQHIREKYNNDTDFIFVAELDRNKLNGWTSASVCVFLNEENK